MLERKEPNVCFNILLAGILAFLIGICVSISWKSMIFFTILIILIPLALALISSSFTFILKCMLLVIFFIPFDLIPYLNLLNVINPLLVLGVICWIKLFKLKFSHKIKIFSYDKTDYLYYLFVCSAFMSSIFAISKLGALNWIFYSLTTGYIVFKIITNMDYEQLNKLISFTVFLAAICAIEGMYEYFTNHSIVFNKPMHRLTSLMGYPLLNGMIFSAVLPLSVELYCRNKKKRFLFTSTAIFIAIIFTLSRGSWLALLVGGTILFLLSNVRRKIKYLFVLLFAAFFFYFIPYSGNNVITRIRQDETSPESSFNIRIRSIPVAFSISKDKPFFGGGPYNSVRYKNKYAYNRALRMTSFENTYLGLLVDLGFIGFFLLCCICLRILMSSLLGIKRFKNYLNLRLAIIVSLCIMLVNMATFNFDGFRVFHFVIWYFLGLCVAIMKITRESYLSEKVNTRK